MTIIRFRYETMDDVAQFALNVLRDRSPVGSDHDSHPGNYRDSHFLYIHGQRVSDAKSWIPATVVMISNPVPYARKIEIGHMSVSVDPHVYEGAVPIIMAEYGKTFMCSFAFLSAPLGDILPYSHSSAARIRARQAMPHAEWISKRPTLIIQQRQQR